MKASCPWSAAGDCGALSDRVSWLWVCHRAIIRREYLQNAARFHHKVAEGKELWVTNRTPDDAGELQPARSQHQVANAYGHDEG